MAFRSALLLAILLAGPAAHRPAPAPDPQDVVQTRMLMKEWRRAIRRAETAEDWAAVDEIARELSRLAARPGSHRTRLTGASLRAGSTHPCDKKGRSAV